jgi:hypothetical protein
LFAAAPAAAQTAAFPDLAAIKRGLSVTVVDDDGRRIDGKVEEVTQDVVRLSRRDVVEVVPLAQVVRVEKQDSLKNGALTGLAIGAMFGIGATIAAGPDPGFAVAAITGNVLLYTFIGVAVDSMIDGRRTLYQRNRAVTATIAPILDRQRRGAAFGISW